VSPKTREKTQAFRRSAVITDITAMEGRRLSRRLTLADERGFTLVEVLVVVLIVGILAALALPAFLNQRSKAQDGEAKQMAAVTAQALHVWHQDHDTFQGAGPDELADIEPAVRTARGLSISATEDTFTVSVESAAGETGGGPFVIEHDTTGVDRTCDVPGRGGCPGDGHW
jgi:type IV pilus assembly protein PilA